jgi:hypothetical protein
MLFHSLLTHWADVFPPELPTRFQAEVDSGASQIYNGKSTIENFSASSALAIAKEIGLLSCVSKTMAKQIYTDIVDLVLSTDMSRHFDLVSSFRTMVTSKQAAKSVLSKSKIDPLLPLHLRPRQQRTSLYKHFFDETPEARMLILKIALKLSDLGHCYLGWEEHTTWCKRLELEFFLQGDVEKEACLDVSPLMDRRKPGVSNHKNSVGFFRAFVLPMLEPWVDLFPSCTPLLEQANANLNQHVRMGIASLDAKRDPRNSETDDSNKEDLLPRAVPLRHSCDAKFDA